jgi:hypothetical protein
MPTKANYFWLVPVVLILLIGCSSLKNTPATPSEQQNTSGISSFDIPVSVVDSSNPKDRNFLGEWTMNFNPDDMSVKLTQNRELESHWNVKPFIPAPQVTVLSYDSFTGILEVNVTITNPTAISAYDLRMIVFTDNYGIRLRNPDNWTALYDIPGGLTINPFRAYAKTTDLRIFEGGGKSHTERLQLYFPSGIKTLDFAIDASFPGNCDEPYEIRNYSCGKIYEELGSSAVSEVKVYDWQFDVDYVALYCPAVTGQAWIQYTRTGSVTWQTKVTNNASADPGKYKGAIAASSDSGKTALYDLVEISITPITGWARTWGSSEYDAVRAVTTDFKGNIYTTGMFSGSVDFDPGDGVVMKQSNGGGDIFISKINPLGELMWVQTFGTASGDELGMGIVTDSTGNVYITGRWTGYDCDFDPGPGQDIHPINGWDEIFVTKFDSLGNHVWARTFGSPLYDWADIGRGIAIDPLDNIYITGGFKDIVDLSPGGGVDQYVSKGQDDIFVSSLDKNGNYRWGLAWGSDSYDYGFAVTVDNSGDIIATGSFYNTIDFDPGYGVQNRTSNGYDDVYLCKLDKNKNFIWCKTWGGAEYDYGKSVAVDSSDNVFVTGDMCNVVDFDPTGEVWERTSSGGNDPFLSKFDEDGNFIWAGIWGTLNWNEEGLAVAIDSKDNVYLTGAVVYTWLDFDPNDGQYWVLAVGWDENYMLKLDNNCNFQWVRIWGGGWIEEYGDRCYGVAVDPDDYVIAGGAFKDRGDWDPGDRVSEHVSNGAEDAFLIKFNERGYWND